MPEVGKLVVGEQHRAALGDLIVEVGDDVFEWATRLGLIVVEHDGTRFSAGTVRDEVELALQALARAQIQGTFPLIQNEAALASSADIPAQHVPALAAQSWGQLNRLALEWLARQGLLPRVHAQRLVSFSDVVTRASEGSYDLNGRRVLTILAATALLPGYGELITDAVVLAREPSSLRSRFLRRPGGGGPMATSAIEALTSLMQEADLFQRNLRRVGAGSSTALPPTVPWVADVWHFGPADSEAGQLAPGVVAPGDIPRAVATLTRYNAPAIFAALVSSAGPHIGSFGVNKSRMKWDASGWIRADRLTDDLLAFADTVARDFEQIPLKDEYGRGERFGVSEGVRFLASDGGLINDGTPDAVLLRQRRRSDSWEGSEPMAFVHNLPLNERGKDLLIQGVQALTRMRSENATNLCVPSTIAELGAPYTVRGTTVAAKMGMLGLGAFFRILAVAAVREHERTHALSDPDDDT